MIVRTVKSRSVQANRRLDCRYFLSPGTQAAERLAVAAAAGVELRAIGGPAGVGEVWAPSRFRRAYAAPGEAGRPYLRPYDVFDYVPQAADLLSVARSDNLSTLMAPPGALLQTCSGRNLGPAVAVDAHLARFALSHDLIRVEINDPRLRHYVLAFLATPTGQALVRRDKTGSVIDHISVGHLEQVAVPLLNAVYRDAARQMAYAIRQREEARLTLASAIETLNADLPPIVRPSPSKRGWTVPSSFLGPRIDSAYHDPVVAQIRADLRATGGPTLGDVAEVRKPSGRYKTYYVDARYGRPILSGRQVLQYAPVNLQFISPRSLDPTRYELRHRSIVLQADGRAEERLGVPVMIEPARAGWLASGHVGRLVPRRGIDPAWLYVAMASTQVQTQIKALACGSVVDALYEDDLRQVVLPAPGGVDSRGVMSAWERFSKASLAHERAVILIEEELTRLTGETQRSA